MVFLARFRELSSEVAHHTLLSSPVIALGLSALSLLLLVLVLLSVPGPIKGLYWFSVDGEQSGMGQLKSGVLGWCGESKRNGGSSRGFSRRYVQLHLCAALQQWVSLHQDQYRRSVVCPNDATSR